jgi:hypothetical protein
MSASRATISTCAPRPSSSRQMARPMPALAPVTSARCPSRVYKDSARAAVAKTEDAAAKEKAALDAATQ